MRNHLVILLALPALALTGCGDDGKKADDSAVPPTNGSFLDGGAGHSAIVNGVDTSDPAALIGAYFEARNEPQDIGTQCAFMAPTYVDHLIDWVDKGGLFDCADVVPEDPFTAEDTDPIEVIDQRIEEAEYFDDYYGGSVTQYRVKHRTLDDHTDEGTYEVTLVNTPEGLRIADVDN